MEGFLQRLQWRSATKVFDERKPISQDQLNQVMEAIRWVPTSFGLQPFYVKVVQSPDVRKKLFEAGWNQTQFLNCTAAFVFVADTRVSDRFDKQMELRAQSDPSARTHLAGYESMVKGWISQQSPETIKPWVQRQIYIALGFALAACAEIGIDSCPMEGFNPEAFDKILNLPIGHYSTVVLTVGNRLEQSHSHPKWRFPKELVFELV